MRLEIKLQEKKNYKKHTNVEGRLNNMLLNN